MPTARKLAFFAAAAVLLGAAVPSAIAAPPAHVASALADQKRPAEDRARDAARKPGEMLAFAEVKAGDKVADLVIGGGYFTRILAAAVGPTGKVYAYQPSEFTQFAKEYAEAPGKVAAIYPNVVPVVTPFAEVAFPEPVDLVFTAQNYHDFHIKEVPAGTAEKVNRAVFKALKPGGVYLIIDHFAAPGSGLTVIDSLHRIDAKDVRSEVTAAGFVYEGAIEDLRNPADPRTANVFDKAIRGHTDQFVYKFRKPR